MVEKAKDGEEAAVGVGSQTLMRGLDVIEVVAEGAIGLPELAARLGLSKSTTYRLANALADRGYLASTPRAGFRLGRRLLSLGAIAREQADLIQVARPHLETLAAVTEDTVHLGVLDGGQALYLDKMPGRRRISISSRVGERQPLTSTGLGKALLLDHPYDYWVDRLDADADSSPRPVDRDVWIDRMRGYATEGRAFDLEENEDRIRCVAAPLRDATGVIVGAISVSSAAQYMSDERMDELSGEVRGVAASISRDLGWNPDKPARHR